MEKEPLWQKVIRLSIYALGWFLGFLIFLWEKITKKGDE